MQIGKSIEGRYHDYFSHYYLSFDIDAGRDEFRTAVNWIHKAAVLATVCFGAERNARWQ
ncbi:MAG TPA: hypothetical protein VFQ34_13470 [Nitrospiraceae bacterium]|nr:hypothetical protein [Nitrospiraceae bacterium]